MVLVHTRIHQLFIIGSIIILNIFKPLFTCHLLVLFVLKYCGGFIHHISWEACINLWGN